MTRFAGLELHAEPGGVRVVGRHENVLFRALTREWLTAAIPREVAHAKVRFALDSFVPPLTTSERDYLAARLALDWLYFIECNPWMRYVARLLRPVFGYDRNGAGDEIRWFLDRNWAEKPAEAENLAATMLRMSVPEYREWKTRRDRFWAP